MPLNYFRELNFWQLIFVDKDLYVLDDVNNIQVYLRWFILQLFVVKVDSIHETDLDTLLSDRNTKL